MFFSLQRFVKICSVLNKFRYKVSITADVQLLSIICILTLMLKYVHIHVHSTPTTKFRVLQKLQNWNDAIHYYIILNIIHIKVRETLSIMSFYVLSFKEKKLVGNVSLMSHCPT